MLRNEGFVMDCLLGNWDAVFNLQNLVMDASGHAMRIDTGNSLISERGMAIRHQKTSRTSLEKSNLVSTRII